MIEIQGKELQGVKVFSVTKQYKVFILFHVCNIYKLFIHKFFKH